MTEARPTARRLNSRGAALLLLGAAAWLAVASPAGMGGMTGAMAPGLAAFMGMWALMMTAMMLPSVAPVASLYLRALRGSATRMALFCGGYLVVWAASGVPAYFVNRAASGLAARSPAAGTATAVAIFAVCGLYQLTPLKERCLRHCRSPLGHLLHLGSFRGPLRDLKAGAYHGAFCLGCCWALMLLFVAVGVMNLVVMVVLTAVVLLEKQWARGESFSRLVGVVALVAAVAVIWLPGLAPGLRGAGMPMSATGEPGPLPGTPMAPMAGM